MENHKPERVASSFVRRRTFLKRFTALTAGLVLVRATDSGVSQAAAHQDRSRGIQSTSDSQQIFLQSNWRWCRKCQGMYFGGNPMVGRSCPAGGSHDGSASGNYALQLNSPSAPGQTGWRWCHKCQGLHFIGGNSGKGFCPAGDGHSIMNSGDYTLIQNSPSAPGQSNWRFCQKCAGLHFAGNATLGSCPADGQHTLTGSGNYTIRLV